MNDNRLYSECFELKEVIDSLPLGFYVVAYAMYTLTESY